MPLVNGENTFHIESKSVHLTEGVLCGISTGERPAGPTQPTVPTALTAPLHCIGLQHASHRRPIALYFVNKNNISFSLHCSTI